MRTYEKITVKFDDPFVGIRLKNGKGNIIDRAMMTEITSVVNECKKRDRLKGILFTAEGDHFSFGASVPEHQADLVAGMLKAFHDLFRQLIDCSLPTLSAVQGQCLGGGFELVSFTHWIFAAPGSKFGQPEINLGVFPPVASLILPFRLGQTMADDINLTGRSWTADELRQRGLIFEISDNPEKAAFQFMSEHLAPKSAAAIRHTVRSSRHAMIQAFLKHIDEVERDYLDKLVKTHDANEGIKAFMEKRKPDWKNA